MTTGPAASNGQPRPAERRVARLVELVKRPVFLTDASQIFKSVIAATSAWWFSVAVLETSMPFLSPWTALLTVHATVYQSLSRGVQTSIASALGVGLSFLIGSYLGVGVWTFALALLVGLVAARTPWIRDEGVAIATTAIFILSNGFDDQAPLLLDRLFEVGVGVVAGIAVNFLIVPPLRDGQAARHVDSINRRMGDVLVNMADELSTSWNTDNANAWLEATKSMEREVNSAWQVVWFARESHRANPRNYLGPHRRTKNNSRPSPESGRADYGEILIRVDEGISHLRNLSRTLREATYAGGEWDARFRKHWVAIVRDCGRSIADPDADVEPIRDRLTTLSQDMSDDHNLPKSAWPTYGSLITNMRHIATIVDDVASTREAREDN
ncbi:aromatic acid exporter family protein [Nesterenkonia halotolerans]|uniref:FUSC family protein n=1 Tax=Nesterenkonia halotolerans TaxID=225325 RepID=UPI003EE6B209